MPGDYNGDGAVSAEDYGVWKSSFGQTGGPADCNNDGIVDAVDYTIWRNNLGAILGSGSPATVPEPGSLVLLTVASMFALSPRSVRLIDWF